MPGMQLQELLNSFPSPVDRVYRGKYKSFISIKAVFAYILPCFNPQFFPDVTSLVLQWLSLQGIRDAQDD